MFVQFHVCQQVGAWPGCRCDIWPSRIIQTDVTKTKHEMYSKICVEWTVEAVLKLIHYSLAISGQVLQHQMFKIMSSLDSLTLKMSC